jgi:hypothetical protein
MDNGLDYFPETVLLLDQIIVPICFRYGAQSLPKKAFQRSVNTNVHNI